MTDEIEKLENDDNKSKENEVVQFTGSSIGLGRKYPFGWLLIKVVLAGLFLFVTNGLVPLGASILLTLIVVLVLAYNEFYKHRGELGNAQYQIGVVVVFVFFSALSYLLNSLNRDPATQQTAHPIDSTESKSISMNRDPAARQTAHPIDSAENKSITIIPQGSRKETKPTISSLARPYVVLDFENPFSGTIEVGQPISITVQCKNVGETMAHDYYHINTYFWADNRIPIQKDLDDIFTTLQRHSHEGFPMAPNQTFKKESMFHHVFSPTDSAIIYSGQATFYLMGAITYRDGLGVRHLTWYCFSFIPTQGIFSAYSKFNGAT